MKTTTRKPKFAHVAHCVTAAMLFAVVGPAAAMDPPSIPLLSDTQVQEIQNGGVIVDVQPGEVPEGDAIGIIEHPPLAVIEVIRDFASYSDYMDDISESEVLGQEGDITICRGETDTPWPMSDRDWTIRATGGEAQVDGVDVILSTWTYVPESGNIVDTQGYWLMIPWGDDGQQTLLRYHLSVDLGTWLPDFLLEWSTENFLPTRITAIRDRVNELAAAQ